MNFLKQAVFSIWGAGSVGSTLKTTVRPLLVSPPVKPKRPPARGAKLVFDEYASARHVRDKMLRKPVTGKQEQLGMSSGLYAPVAFASCLENERIALSARVLPQQLPAPGLPDCVRWIEQNVDEIIPRLNGIKPVPWTEYLRRVGSSVAVKKNLVAAKQRLDELGIFADSRLTSTQLRQFVQRSSFVKVENLSYHTPAGLKSKAPRLIQGATPEFVALVGPSIMALQDVVCRRLRPGKSNLVFTSGVSAEKAAEHITKEPGELGFDDIATYDLDQSRPWGELMYRLCKKWGLPQAVLQLIKQNIDTVGKTHHGIRYKCEGTRKSGDPYTSLFNTLINLFSHLYIYCDHFGVSVRQAAEEFFMVAQGDDNAFKHTRRGIVPWRARMLALGFDSEATYCLEYDLDFCSMNLFRCKDGWVFGPKTGRVLSRYGYSINKPPNVSAESYLRGVALGQMKNASFNPILKVFYERILQLTEKHEAYFTHDYDAHSLKASRRHEIDIESFYSLNHRYSWCYSAQNRFEELISNMRIGEEWPDWVQQQLFDRDTDGEKVTYSS